MRRISTDYSNRLPDDYVALVLSKEDVTDIIHEMHPATWKDETADISPTGLISQFRKLLTEGDKGSES